MMTCDVAVFGSGVFGAWAALWLRRAGASVVLLDPYGPGNSRSSSGGESRIIRMGYGPDEIYTQWSIRSLVHWKELAGQTGQRLFEQTGVLWMALEDDVYAGHTKFSRLITVAANTVSSGINAAVKSPLPVSSCSARCTLA